MREIRDNGRRGGSESGGSGENRRDGGLTRSAEGVGDGWVTKGSKR